jgi:hypothetical protein
VAGRAPDRVEDLPHRDTDPADDVVDAGCVVLFEMLSGRDVSGGDVGDVDVVADAGPIRRRVVGTEDQGSAPLAERLKYHRDGVGDAGVTEVSRPGAGDVEVAHQSFTGQLCRTVRADRRGWGGFVDDIGGRGAVSTTIGRPVDQASVLDRETVIEALLRVELMVFFVLVARARR